MRKRKTKYLLLLRRGSSSNFKHFFMGDELRLGITLELEEVFSVGTMIFLRLSIVKGDRAKGKSENQRRNRRNVYFGHYNKFHREPFRRCRTDEKHDCTTFKNQNEGQN